MESIINDCSIQVPGHSIKTALGLISRKNYSCVHECMLSASQFVVTPGVASGTLHMLQTFPFTTFTACTLFTQNNALNMLCLDTHESKHSTSHALSYHT